MRRVGIFRMKYPIVSEAFITEQARALQRYQPLIITRHRCGATTLPTLSLGDASLGRLREALYALTRAPRLFGSPDALGKLSLIHAHFGHDGVYALDLARHLDVPLVVTYHGAEVAVRRSALLPRGRPYLAHYLLGERALRAGGTLHIAVSDFLAARLRARGYPAERLVRHYIGVDTEKFTPAPSPPAERTVLCVGRHTEKKGIDTVIEAFARVAGRHPDVRLIQIGSGPESEALRGLAGRLGVAGRVSFLGDRSHGDVAALMRQAEVFCLASRTARNGDAEALGVVFNEASACAVPVVATRHGGIPEAVLDGETGLLAPEDDAAALADRLDAVLADRALGRRLGARGRELVSDVFDLRKQTARLEDLYDRATA